MKKVGYLFIAPWLIGLLIFTVFPIFYSLYLSFFDVSFTATGIATQGVGIANFVQAISTDITFLRLVGGFTSNALLSIPIIVLLALVIALLLNLDIKGKGIFRTIFFMPVIVSSGPVIDMLIRMGITSIPRLHHYAFYNILASADNILANSMLTIIDSIIILLWLSGVQILIFLAGLQKLSAQTYEAAKIDGASKWEIFWKITLPSISSVILINIIYTTVMYAQSTLNPIITHISDNMFNLQTGFGYSSALAWIYFVVIFLVMGLLAWVYYMFTKEERRR